MKHVVENPEKIDPSYTNVLGVNFQLFYGVNYILAEGVNLLWNFHHNGQIFILRGDKTYTITGQEVN